MSAPQIYDMTSAALNSLVRGVLGQYTVETSGRELYRIIRKEMSNVGLPYDAEVRLRHYVTDRGITDDVVQSVLERVMGHREVPPHMLEHSVPLKHWIYHEVRHLHTMPIVGRA